MRTAPIGELTKPGSTWNPSRNPDKAFFYVDLGAVDNVAKAISAATTVIGDEAPSRARQLVAAGDVLVSTVRPNLNAVAVVPPELDGATASTGFTVLRPADNLDGRYLFQWVRSQAFIADMVRNATGASYPAVSDRTVKGSMIPAPGLEEQRRIAAILDHADALSAKRCQVLANLDALAAAHFFETFRNIDRKSRLRDIGVEFLSGKNVLASGLSSHAVNRVIKVSAMSRGTFVASESKPMPAAYKPPESHRLRRGDILFGRASGSLELLGATAIVDHDLKDLFLPDKVWRLTTRQDAPVVAGYVLGVLRSADARAFIRHNASGAAGVRNIGKAKLLEYLAPLPPLGLQYAYVANAEAIERQRASAARGLGALDELFASLQARAFRGEL